MLGKYIWRMKVGNLVFSFIAINTSGSDIGRKCYSSASVPVQALVLIQVLRAATQPTQCSTQCGTHPSHLSQVARTQRSPL